MSEKRITTIRGRAIRDRRRGPRNRRGNASTQWLAFDALTEAEVESAARADPDARPTDRAFWEDAKLVVPLRKAPVSIRLDQDLLNWFRGQGPGYQSRINAVLRAFMESKKS